MTGAWAQAFNNKLIKLPQSLGTLPSLTVPAPPLPTALARCCACWWGGCLSLGAELEGRGVCGGEDWKVADEHGEGRVGVERG